jgi:hypothetical protein
MIKFCRDKWDKNKDKLIEELKRDTSLNSCDYLYLVKKTVDIILNDDEDNYNNYSTKGITQIDDGDYQGTLLFMIPRNTYQPSEYDYLMTYVGYGSCSGCDCLQSIQAWHYDDPPTEEQIKDFLSLCKDIIQNIVRPYNCGWREDKEFLPCEDN